MLSEPLAITNRRLLDKYGTNLSGMARYRVVFTNDQFEKRKSTFRDFHNGVVLIREVEEVRTVPKYPYAKDCYILEALNRCEGEEVLDHNGYEPLFIFRDKNDNPLDPVWRVIEMVVHVSLHPEKLSPSDFDDKERKEYEKELEYLEQYLDNQSPEIASALHDGVAITVPDLSSTKS